MSLQKMNTAKPGSFNDEAHLLKYLTDKTLPAIHKNFRYVIENYAVRDVPALDIGACIGMICTALAITRQSNVYGVEGNKYDFDRANKFFTETGWRIEMHNFYVNRENMEKLGAIIKAAGIKLVTARRVLSEVGIKDPSIVTEMAKVLSENGVEEMIVEGRAYTKNPIVPLYNTDLECEALKPYFKVVARHKDVCYLQSL